VFHCVPDYEVNSNVQAYFFNCCWLHAWRRVRCGPQTNLFVGDWKLNPSRSKLTDQMKVQSIAANKYAFDFGDGSAEVIAVNGTDQPGNFGTTLSVSIEGPDS